VWLQGRVPSLLLVLQLRDLCLELRDASHRLVEKLFEHEFLADEFEALNGDSG
jgi:hypothetical protein